jgi:prevent-host-death family protein
MAFSFTPETFNVYNVGSFDAKTYFSEFLRKVQGGATVNISKNGKKVAVLQGVKTVQNEAALEAHKRIVARSQKFAALRQQNNFEAMSAQEIKELKDAGRKY